MRLTVPRVGFRKLRGRTGRTGSPRRIAASSSSVQALSAFTGCVESCSSTVGGVGYRDLLDDFVWLASAGYNSEHRADEQLHPHHGALLPLFASSHFKSPTDCASERPALVDIWFMMRFQSAFEYSFGEWSS
jgi:hypothetical protein